MNQEAPTFETLLIRITFIEQWAKRAAIIQKRVLTLQEAAWYSGRPMSYLYKLTSLGLLKHSKPEGKVIYVERTDLEEWMLKNPVKTKNETDRQASTYVTLHKRKTAKSIY